MMQQADLQRYQAGPQPYGGAMPYRAAGGPPVPGQVNAPSQGSASTMTASPFKPTFFPTPSQNFYYQNRAAMNPGMGAFGNLGQFGGMGGATPNSVAQWEQMYRNGYIPASALSYEQGIGNVSNLADPSLDRMIAAARAAGINLTATSSYRNYGQQQALYNAYLQGRGNLAARPGTSEHGWGFALDFNPADYTWLSQNAGRFGWGRTVGSEPWHYAWLPGR